MRRRHVLALALERDRGRLGRERRSSSPIERYAEEAPPDSTRETRREYVHALRVNADGTLVDGAPLELASLVQTHRNRNPSYDGWFGFPTRHVRRHEYVVTWNHNRVC